MKSYTKPTDDLVERALQKLTSIQLRRHFFENLANPYWAEILLNKGYFAKAPDVLREGDSIRFLDWPELEYLERVAEQIPDVAFKVISGIRTDNFFVHKSAIEVALKLPADLAARFTQETLINWFTDSASIFTVDALLNLCKYLAKEKNPAALKIIDKVLFATEKDEEKRKIKTKVWREWDFEKAAKDLERPLIEAFDVGYLQVLCFKLKQALWNEYGVGEDRSTFWQSAIEPHKQDEYRKGPKHTLLAAVRNAASALLETKSDEVFGILNQFSFSIFRRIEIYLAGSSGAKIHEQLEKILNPAFFWELDFHHEIYHFLQKQFVNFRPDEQQRVLRMISAGPPDKEDMQSEKSRKYDAIKDYITDEFRGDYESLPKISNADFLIYSETMWSGPTSPLEDDAIERSSASELVAFIKAWKPSSGWREPTPRGLGRGIENDIKKNPSKYVGELTQFQIEYPTYVAHILGAIQAWDKDIFNEQIWDEVLCLSEWVVERPIKIEGREIKDNFNDDPDWQWTRRAVVSLLNSKMRTSPLGYRGRIWKLISTVIQDNDPSPEEEKKSLKNDRNPYSIAINSTKGDALHAVVEYGLWLRNVDKNIVMPEFFELLDKQVNEDFGGLFSQRAVFGRFYPWLHLLSPEWAVKNRDSIFPESDIERFIAGWESYISFCDAYKDMFAILESKYLFSLKNQDKIEVDHGYYEDRLASHIITFFLRGEIKQASEVMKKVLSKKTEKHVFVFLGRCMSGRDVPQDVQEKAKSLWDEYINEKVKDKKLTSEQKSVLADFTYWVEAES